MHGQNKIKIIAVRRSIKDVIDFIVAFVSTSVLLDIKKKMAKLNLKFPAITLFDFRYPVKREKLAVMIVAF
jgi:hypothetical protein